MNTEITYKHDVDGIDPRDKHLISYDKNTKHFVVEASDLKGAGIEPQYTTGVLYKGFYLYIWSDKYQIWVLYRENKSKRVMNGEDVIADVFTPDFSIVSSHEELLARKDPEGTELHIIND